MPAPIIIAGMLTGGAIMPSTPPIASMQPVSTSGTPISISIGAMIEPAVSTDAVDEPVIIPGNMMTSIIMHSRSAGTRWNFSRISDDTASSVPDSWMTFMKIIAVAMTSIVST